eukprot:scaffold20031_cov111-Isochrysis_galbana.AAC.1
MWRASIRAFTAFFSLVLLRFTSSRSSRFHSPRQRGAAPMLRSGPRTADSGPRDARPLRTERRYGLVDAAAACSLSTWITSVACDCSAIVSDVMPWIDAFGSAPALRSARAPTARLLEAIL